MSSTAPCRSCGQRVSVGRRTLPEPMCHPCRRDARPAAPTNCAYCARPFIPKWTGRRWPPCCTRRCMQRLRVGTPLTDDYDPDVVPTRRDRDLAKSRRRRLRHALTWDGVGDVQILERDGWRCDICKHKIRTALTYPHPKSRSIDHVVPLSEGGDDTAANKRAAHLDCNMSRGAGGGHEQLALIGWLEPASLQPEKAGVA